MERARRIGVKIMLVSMLILSPLVVIPSVKSKSFFAAEVFAGVAILMVLMVYIPKSKKEKRKSMPERIYTEEEYIVALVGGKEEYRLIADALRLADYGEFYVIDFPVGKVSDKFVCQKDLLVKGTLEEFELLFRDVFIRVGR